MHVLACACMCACICVLVCILTTNSEEQHVDVVCGKYMNAIPLKIIIPCKVHYNIAAIWDIHVFTLL